jgi:hypothetical protein
MKQSSFSRRRKAVKFVREGLDLIEAERRDARLRELSVKKVQESANNSG